MLYSCAQRQVSGRGRAVAAIVPSVGIALGLTLLLPVVSSLVGLGAAHHAHAAPAFHAGGPDAFGYTFKDSNEPGGPVYAWEEISASGVVVTGWTSYDDGYAGPIPIGFNFNYYGADYTDLYIGVNGFVSFGRGYGTIPGGTLPQTSNPNNDIALFGGDLYLYNYGGVSKVYYQTLSNPTRFVVQFVDLHYCCGQNTPHTFQLILYPNGDIQAQYRMLYGTSTTYVGIENATGADGLSYGAALADNLAIRYYYPVGVYLSPVSQTHFSVPGDVVAHRIQLTNRTGRPDSFDLAIQPGYAWPTTTTITRTGVLTDGASISFFAQVAIPASAAPGDVDQATVRVTSATSPTITSTAAITTRATSGLLAYVTLTEANQVALVDAPLHTVLGTVDVGAAGCILPWRAAVHPAGHQVFVSCYNSSSVVVIDANSNAVVATINGVQSAGGIAFSRDDEFALVGNLDQFQVAVVHTKNYTVSAIATPGSTRSIAAHPYLDVAYVTSSDGTILVIDTINFTVLTSIDIPGYALDVAVSPDGRWVFAGDQYGAGLAVIDASTNAVHTVLTGLGSLASIEVAPDGSRVYVGTISNSMHVIDGVTFQVLATVTGINQVWELEATCDGTEVWVGNYSNRVPVIDAASNVVAQSIDMPGRQAVDVAICPQFRAEGVFLIPPNLSNAGARGHTVTHRLTLVNATEAGDTFALALSAAAWPATLSTAAVGPVAPGHTASFTVSVTIPAGVPWYARDTALVTATSVSDPGLSGSASVTTIADSPPVMAVAPAALSSVQPVNQTVDQTLAISNGNGVTLTVELTDVDLTPGLLRLAPLDLPLAGDAFQRSSATSEDAKPATTPPPPPDDVTRALAPGHEHAVRAVNGDTYNTTIDNENNALTGVPDYDMDYSVCDGDSREPIEFNIFVDSMPGMTGNVLTVRAYDVDWPDEVDEVRLNGVYLGNLTGGNEIWSETTFAAPAGLVVMGANLVQIDLSNGWCAAVDWGELFVSGHPAGWLHQTPAAASVASNSAANIVVTFDSSGLQPGEYRGAVIVSGNDPARPYLSTPVTMTVEATADMGRVRGAVSDAWTQTPLTATVQLQGVFTMTARPDYEIWAAAGDYTLTVSAAGYATATVPVVIPAGDVIVRDVALEPNLPRLEWGPQAVAAAAATGGRVQQTLVISNTGPAPLDIALFEINLDFNRSAPRPAELTGKRILYDRAHGQPATSQYSRLVDDAIAAGAVVDVNWYFPIEAAMLQGYDILWTNCCGGVSWTFSELQAISHWLQSGGAVLVQGESSAATTGPASIFGIHYMAGTCTSGTTTSITQHPISANVQRVRVDSTCWRLAPSIASDIVVSDTVGQPHIVARQYNSGKMVVLASEDLIDGTIVYEDNRLLGNNILAWLARPAYTDVPWLSLSPITGTLPGHSSLAIVVELDAAGLDEGVYEAALAIEHGDQAQAFPVELPVTFTVLRPQDRVKYLPLILVQ